MHKMAFCYVFGFIMVVILLLPAVILKVLYSYEFLTQMGPREADRLGKFQSVSSFITVNGRQYLRLRSVLHEELYLTVCPNICTNEQIGHVVS